MSDLLPVIIAAGVLGVLFATVIWRLAETLYLLERKKQRSKQIMRACAERAVRNSHPLADRPLTVSPNDLFVWASGTVLPRKEFKHSEDLGKYGHDFTILYEGTWDWHQVMDSLRGPSSLETTEDEATL